MAKCNLAIEFDRPERRYTAGDTISGRVTVQVDAPCRCDGLTVTRLWRTHGRGNAEQGGETQSVPFRGEWQPGEVHTFPFSFTAPAWPVTYHGTLVNVDHYVRARADIPWAIDPKAEEDFLLAPGPESLARPAAVQVGPVEEPHTNALGTAFGVLCGLSFIAASAYAVTFGPTGLLTGTFHPPLAAFFGGLTVAGGLLAFHSARKVLVERRLGRVDVQVQPREVDPGGALEVAVTVAPPSRVKLNAVRATLVGREEAVSGFGTNRSFHLHTLHTDTQELHGPADASTDEGTTARGTFLLPADAAPSFQAVDNGVRWTLKLHVDVARWPDWTSTELLFVRPVPERA